MPLELLEFPIMITLNNLTAPTANTSTVVMRKANQWSITSTLPTLQPTACNGPVLGLIAVMAFKSKRQPIKALKTAMPVEMKNGLLVG